MACVASASTRLSPSFCTRCQRLWSFRPLPKRHCQPQQFFSTRVTLGAGPRLKHVPNRSLTAAAQSEKGRPSNPTPYEALLVDVGGTLLQTAEPVPETYASIGRRYGVKATPADIKKGFKEAFSRPWTEALRYEGDGRVFWRYAVELATGCSDPAFFEELYQHYAKAAAWTVAPGALEALKELRAAGVKLAVVSNFDTRLRPLLEELWTLDRFDQVIVSAEVGFEKPSPEIFKTALKQLGISTPSKAVHVGDDPVADVQGAQAVGMEAWLWKKDVMSFEEIARRVLSQHLAGAA